MIGRQSGRRTAKPTAVISTAVALRSGRRTSTPVISTGRFPSPSFRPTEGSGEIFPVQRFDLCTAQERYLHFAVLRTASVDMTGWAMAPALQAVPVDMTRSGACPSRFGRYDDVECVSGRATLTPYPPTPRRFLRRSLRAAGLLRAAELLLRSARPLLRAPAGLPRAACGRRRPGRGAAAGRG